MDKVQGFLDHELASIERAIHQIQSAIDTAPANNHHPDGGMQALLRVQHNHRRIVESLRAQATDAETALNACRAFLIAVEEEHALITARGGAGDLRHADSWWDTLNELQYVADLSSRLENLVSKNHHR